MKSQSLSLSLLAVALVPATAVAEWYVMEDGVLYALAEATVTYDSNIFTNSSEVESVIYEVRPGVQFIRDAGYLRLEAEAGVEFSKYTDRSQFNSQDPFASLLLDMPFRDEDYPLALRAEFDYADEVVGDPTVNDRVNRTTLQSDGRADYRYSEYFTGWLAASYEYYDYDEESGLSGGPLPGAPLYVGSDVISTELGSVYHYSPRLDVGLSTRLRWTDHDVWKSTDYAFFGVVEGQILPRTTGTVRVGAQYREFADDAADDEWLPYVSVQLDWEADDNTSWILAVTSDYLPTAASESVSLQSVSVTLRQGLIAKIDAYFSAVLEHVELDNNNPAAAEREDDALRFVVGADYTLTELMTLHGEVNWETRDSNYAISEFDRLVAQIGLRVRY